MGSIKKGAKKPVEDDSTLKVGRKSHNPTKESRLRVLKLTIAGVDQKLIAECVGLKSDESLRKHYKKEIQEGQLETLGEIAYKLVQKAKDGNDTLMMFFMKTRGGWKENAAVDLNVGPPIALKWKVRLSPKHRLQAAAKWKN